MLSEKGKHLVGSDFQQGIDSGVFSEVSRCPKTVHSLHKERVSQDWSEGVCLVSDGNMTRCSSIRLAWERRMRLKKSSSGTVGPLVGGGGGAHL